jgi:hypothetical protein
MVSDFCETEGVLCVILSGKLLRKSILDFFFMHKAFSVFIPLQSSQGTNKQFYSILNY